MDYKAVVPKTISKALGEFRLSRALTNRLLATIHHDLPAEYEASRKVRTTGHEETYQHRIVLEEDGKIHLFLSTVDDSTAQGLLFITEIRHASKNLP